MPGAAGVTGAGGLADVAAAGVDVEGGGVAVEPLAGVEAAEPLPNAWTPRWPEHAPRRLVPDQVVPSLHVAVISVDCAKAPKERLAINIVESSSARIWFLQLLPNANWMVAACPVPPEQRHSG